MKDTVQKAGNAINTAMSSNQKITDMKRDMIEPTSKDVLTSDFGTKQPDGAHDIWLHASTGDRQGPALLEDNFGREKVCLSFKRVRAAS